MTQKELWAKVINDARWYDGSPASLEQITRHFEKQGYVLAQKEQTKGIDIWDNHNRQWLEPIAIFFGKENTVWKVQACLPGANPLTDGWYDIEGDALSKIAITGELSHNTGLAPKQK